MKEQKELTYPKALRVLLWIPFAMMLLFGIVAFIGGFNESIADAANSTMQSSLNFSIIFFSICLLLLPLQFALYKRKIVATESSAIFYYAFKKSVEVPYSQIGKCVFNYTRGLTEFTVFDVNNKKIIRMNNDLNIIVDFMDFLESKDVKTASLYEELTSAKK